MKKKEFYFIGKGFGRSNLYIHGFGDYFCKKKIRDVIAVSLSYDEMLLAYTNELAQIVMYYDI